MDVATASLSDIRERLGDLRPSQSEFLFSPEPYSMLFGGWGSGKTTIGCVKGLILSAAYPNNCGLVGRYHATDLEDSTMPMFFELCPEKWIKPGGWKKARKTLTLKNGSTVLFRHIHDPNPRRRHITSINLGWFFIDQVEEIELQHWNTLIGRLRRKEAIKRFGFGAGNPNGKDWIFDSFYKGYRPFAEREFYQTHREGSRLGIAVRSEENAKSNGGFVDDDYFVSLRGQMEPAWVRRYLDCSFEEFSGKIWSEYSLTSIHNIKPFQIPSHWNMVVGIDVGGDHPWSITVDAIDEHGNMITTKEFFKPSVNVAEVAAWIKANTPWNSGRCLFVIDWENKLAMLELSQDHAILCRPAIKKVHPGILRVGGYVHVRPKPPFADSILPDWYKDTQPPEAYAKWSKVGSPKWFIFENVVHTRRAFDRYIWDPKNPKKPLKKDDDPCDARRYATMARPPVSKLPVLNERREWLKKASPVSAKEWAALDRRIAIRMRRFRGSGRLDESMRDETTPPSLTATRAVGKYDWGD